MLVPLICVRTRETFVCVSERPVCACVREPSFAWVCLCERMKDRKSVFVDACVPILPLSLSLSLSRTHLLISRAWMQILSLIHKDTRARIFTHITHTHTHHLLPCACAWLWLCVCVCGSCEHKSTRLFLDSILFFEFFFGQEEGRHKNCLHPGVWLTISYKFKLTLKCYLSIS